MYILKFQYVISYPRGTKCQLFIRYQEELTPDTNLTVYDFEGVTVSVIAQGRVRSLVEG